MWIFICILYVIVAMIFGRLFCRTIGAPYDHETVEAAILVSAFWPLVLVALIFMSTYNIVSKYVADPIFEKLNERKSERDRGKEENH